MCRHFLNVLYVFYLIQLRDFRVRSQTVQSYLWNLPNGNLSDLSQTFTAGTTVPLSWNGWISPDYLDAETTPVDLWVTAFDYNANPFSQLLIGRNSLIYLHPFLTSMDYPSRSSLIDCPTCLENINVTIPGTYAWTIAIPDSNLVAGNQYVLRFEPNSASTYNVNTEELSSPGFLVIKATTSSTSTSSSSKALSSSTSSTKTASSTTKSTLTTSEASATTSSSLSKSSAVSTGLSSGAIGGIGAGVVIAVLALAVFTYFVFRRKILRGRTPGELTTKQYGNGMPSGQERHVSTNYPFELPARGTWGIAELPARP